MNVDSKCFLAVLLYVAVRRANGFLRYDVDEGMVVNMNCTVAHDVQTNQSYSVTWYQYQRLWTKPADKQLVANRKDGVSKSFGKWKEHVKVLANGSLLIFSTVAVRDDAIYKCHVTDAAGFDELVENRLHVQSPVSPPDVGGIADTVQVIHEGERVVYGCNATSFYQVEWILNVSLIWTNLLTGMTQDNVNCHAYRFGTIYCYTKVYFTATANMDGYQFRCMANRGTRHLHISSAFRIQVLYAPRMSITVYPGKNVKNGTDVIFSCNAVANPQPRYTWHGFRFPDGGRTYDKPVFALRNVSARDNGDWRCVVDNGYGKNDSTITLVVITVYPTQGPFPTIPPPTKPPPLQPYGVVALALALLCLLIVVVTVIVWRRRGVRKEAVLSR